MPLMWHNLDYKTLIADGCQLAQGMPALAFGALARVALDDPCRTGCAFFERGTCTAYQKHHTRPVKEAAEREANKAADALKASTDQSGLIGGRWAGMSIRQIAQQEGVSLNVARERKREGKYRE